MGSIVSAVQSWGGLFLAYFCLRKVSQHRDALSGEQQPELPPEQEAAAAPILNEGEPLIPEDQELTDDWEDLDEAVAEHQESDGCLDSLESKKNDLEGTTSKLQSSPTEDVDCVRPEEQLCSTQLIGTESLSFSDSVNYPEVFSSEGSEPSGPAELLKEVETSEKSPSGNVFEDKHEEPLKTLQVTGPDLVDHENWEMVPRNSVCRDDSKGKCLEPSHADLSVLDFQISKPNQGEDYQSDSKRVAAVSPLSQQVNIQFQIHYVAISDSTTVAVTGDNETLGSWCSYIPLQCDKDGLWSTSVLLPVDTALKWKFVIVENGSIVRWEECSNRVLETGHEDAVVYKHWGCH